jgi:hypothetical protein
MLEEGERTSREAGLKGERIRNKVKQRRGRKGRRA